jgi:hypothetical protein
VRVDVGPVARGSAVAWIAWADEVCGELRDDPSRGFACSPALSDTSGYLQQWKRSDLSAYGPFRWHAEVDPDQLEYLIYGLLRLDAQLAVEVEDGRRPPAPSEGREFHQVLMRDLLHALAMEGTGRAAFVDQLRCCWPGAAEAS